MNRSLFVVWSGLFLLPIKLTALLAQEISSESEDLFNLASILRIPNPMSAAKIPEPTRFLMCDFIKITLLTLKSHSNVKIVMDESMSP